MSSLLAALILAAAPGVAPQDEPYKHPPESERQEGVPQGKVRHFVWKSQIFPGTIRFNGQRTDEQIYPMQATGERGLVAYVAGEADAATAPDVAVASVVGT